MVPERAPEGGAAGLLCPINLSEGRDRRRLAELVEVAVSAAGPVVLDLHADPDHHRAVLTLGAADPDRVERAVRAVAARAVELLDLRQHQGVHPRLGVVDVVPFVPLDPAGSPAGPGDPLGPALAARDRFCRFASQSLTVPCFRYGPERSLPEVRRRAFLDLDPDTGPPDPHPSAGAMAVGARAALLAYNLWLDRPDLTAARRIAAAIRGPDVRALGLPVGGVVQVSCNLLAPTRTGPAQVAEEVARLAGELGCRVQRAELVGLAPLAVVEAVPPAARAWLDLDPARTVEARLQAAAGGADPWLEALRVSGSGADD